MKTLAQLCFGNSPDWFPGPQWSFFPCVCLLFNTYKKILLSGKCDPYAVPSPG